MNSTDDGGGTPPGTAGIQPPAWWPVVQLVVVWSLAIAVIGLGGMGATWTWVWRDRYPLRQRGWFVPGLTVLSCCTVAVMVAVRETVGAARFPCGIYLAVCYAFPAGYAVPLLLRSAQALTRLHTNGRRQAESIFVRRWWPPLIIWLLALAAHLLPAAVQWLNVPHTGAGCRFTTEWPVFIVFAAFYTALLAVVFVAMVRAHEAYLLRSEVALVFVVTVVGSTVFLVTQMLPTHAWHAVDRWLHPSNAIVVMTVACTWITMGRPLWYAWRHNRTGWVARGDAAAAASADGQQPPSCAEVLRSVEWRQFFIDYCLAEALGPLIWLWEQIGQYRGTTFALQSERAAGFRRIFTKFLDGTGPLYRPTVEAALRDRGIAIPPRMPQEGEIGRESLDLYQAAVEDYLALHIYQRFTRSSWGIRMMDRISTGTPPASRGPRSSVELVNRRRTTTGRQSMDRLVAIPLNDDRDPASVDPAFLG